MYHTEYLFLGAGLAILLFQLWNQQKYLIHWVSLFVILNFGVAVLWQLFYNNWLFVMQAFSGVGLIMTYALRFKSKQQVLFTDHLKWLGIMLIIGIPLMPHLRSLNFELLDYSLTLSGIVIFTIYVYDRWVMRPETMTRRFWVILVCQTLAILLMLVYALVQRNAAIRNEAIAKGQEQRALELLRQSETERAQYEKAFRDSLIQMEEELVRLRGELKK